MRFSILTFIFCVLTASLSYAENTQPKYSNAALLKAWEDNQRSQPTTVRFEKTNDANIYNFETTLFPYKGKVVVHNVLVHKDIEYYGNYDASEAAEITGIIEAELIDAPDRFKKTLYESISVWRDQNKMLFFDETQSWMTASQWEKWKEQQGAVEKDGKGANSKTSPDRCFLCMLIFLIPVLIFLVFLYFLRRNTNKYRQSHNEKLDQTIKLQKEQTELLKEMLTEKGK